MNNSKYEYEAIIKQAEKAEGDEKINCVITILSMIGTNHLPCIDRKIKKLYKTILIVGVAILVAILGQNQISLGTIISLIGKLL